MSALAKNYNRRKIAFKKGKGSFLYSTNGKKYLLYEKKDLQHLLFERIMAICLLYKIHLKESLKVE